MLELTKEQAIEEHRKMWRWIAEETEKRQWIVDKDDYIKQYFPDKHIYNNCFCCAYGDEQDKHGDFRSGMCTYCPIEWKSKSNHFMCVRKEFVSDNKGLFRLWADTADWKESAKIAKQIAELPERE